MNSLQHSCAMRALLRLQSLRGLPKTACSSRNLKPSRRPRRHEPIGNYSTAARPGSVQMKRRVEQGPMMPTSRAASHSKNGPLCCSKYSTRVQPEPQPEVQSFFDPDTGTWQYIVSDSDTLEAVIIDPVLDYDAASQEIRTENADSLISIVEEKRYHVSHILETHAHADHITAASYLQNRLGHVQGQKPLIGIGKRIGQVQELFSKRYGIPAAECDGVFDLLFDDDQTFRIGGLTCTVLHLPGHTPDHVGYLVGDNVFCGDSIFHPDIGTARCDFPGGSSSQLYQSGRKLLALADHVKIWTGHDYPPKERKGAVPFLAVREHRERNKHLADGVSQEQYVAMRTSRDRQMGAPRLLHPSLQMNIRGGHLPAPSATGFRLLHLPLKLGTVEW